MKKLWVIVSKEKFQACIQPDFHKQKEKEDIFQITFKQEKQKIYTEI